MSTTRKRGFYHSGHRELQDRFDSRRIADRLVEALHRTRFSADDVAFIEGCRQFFLATAGARGRLDCSYKGGAPGFVRVVAPDTLAFPDYDGNGMFRSLGNVRQSPEVGLLFIDFERPRRLRVNGRARVSGRDPLLEAFPGARLIVRVRARDIFPNCPRYIHSQPAGELSTYVPRAGHEPPTPAWKEQPAFRDALPRPEALARRRREKKGTR